MDTILVVNAGSSSVKFQVFATQGAKLERLLKGQMDSIGTRPRLRARGADGAQLIDKLYTPDEVGDPKSALEAAGAWLRATQNLSPSHCRGTSDRARWPRI
jgi:acetate kinase